MQTLKIVAASPESARGLLDTLLEFDVEFVHAADGGYEVTVTLHSSDREIVAVLNAIETYIDGVRVARGITLGEREYVMHPHIAQ